jgi:hypothetical protein
MKILLTVSIIGVLFYFNFAMPKSLMVNNSMETAVNLLGVSLLGLLQRKFIAKEMHYVAHLWCEKVNPEGKPYPIFEIYIIIACLVFLIISVVILVKEILVMW